MNPLYPFLPEIPSSSPAAYEQNETPSRPQATAPMAPPKPPYPTIGSKRPLDAMSVSTFGTPSMNYSPPATDPSTTLNEPAIKKQKKASISCRKMRQLEDRIAFLDRFKKNHRGKLPTHRGIMKNCECGFNTVQKLIEKYAEKHGTTVK